MKLGGLWNSKGGRQITAQDIRALTAQVDAIANNNVASSQAVSALEKRVDRLIDALNIAREAGKALPRDLEKLLVGLVDKLEKAQFRHIDDASLAHLEDRVTMLVKRLDAADAKLAHLDAFERGLADLLAHIERMRRVNRGAASASRSPPLAARAVARDITRNFIDQNGSVAERAVAPEARLAKPPVVADPGTMDFIAAARRAARAAASEPPAQQPKTAAAVAARASSVLRRAMRRVAFAACLGLVVVGGLASRAELVSAVTPPAGGQPAASVPPSWVVPEITGALPRPDAIQVPPGPGRSAAIVEDKLPTTIGNQALRAAVIAGDPAAAYEVASRFAEGRGVPPSNEEEARWLERAAKQGLAPAQFRLGGLYEKGIGVKKDLLRARDLYLAAARKGNAKAMHNLAVLYAGGVSGTPDYNSVAFWFRKAADHGVKDSQFNLAVLYARGIGVEQNYAESYKWFVLAANQGDRDSAVKRDEAAAHLDPRTLEAVRLAVQSWSPEPQPDDAINVKTQAAWEAPVEAPYPSKPKPRPGRGETRAADARPN
jgi:TPR repeat protein